jgi:uncharacterized protein YdhG (YjbR/CyaY superfamily)
MACPRSILTGSTWRFFAAWKNHVVFYPAGSREAFKKEQLAFKEELAPFQKAKGTVQFPLDTPIPFELVKRIVKLRVKENELKKGSSYERAAAIKS